MRLINKVILEMSRIVFSLCLAFIASFVTAQAKYLPVDDLKFYADIMANAGNPDHKQRAHDEFLDRFDKWINSSDFDKSLLSDIDWLSVKSPEDQSFTIVTWQLSKDINANSYYGYIIKNGKVTRLTASEDLGDMEYDVLSATDWAGVLYYNILTVQESGQNLYILFGYDAHQNYESRKIADVLTFDGDTPVFGKEVFKEKTEGRRDKIKNRLVLDYASDSNVSLNYNPSLKMIVFDHLIPRMGRIPGQGPTMLPDGSYVGYKWDGTHFNYIAKIYDQTQEVAPFPKPVLGSEADKRNIMGQNANKKKKRRQKG